MWEHLMVEMTAAQSDMPLVAMTAVSLADNLVWHLVDHLVVQ